MSAVDHTISLCCRDILHIRCALGQSRADFGRSLGVDWETVLAWEGGSLTPDAEHLARLIRMGQQADAFAEKTMLRPALEVALKARKLGQIHESEVRL